MPSSTNVTKSTFCKKTLDKIAATKRAREEAVGVCIQYNQVSDQKSAQSFEYSRFVMLFGSRRVYRSKKIGWKKSYVSSKSVATPFYNIVGKSYLFLK